MRFLVPLVFFCVSAPAIASAQTPGGDLWSLPPGDFPRLCVTRKPERKASPLPPLTPAERREVIEQRFQTKAQLVAFGLPLAVLGGVAAGASLSGVRWQCSEGSCRTQGLESYFGMLGAMLFAPVALGGATMLTLGLALPSVPTRARGVAGVPSVAVRF